MVINEIEGRREKCRVSIERRLEYILSPVLQIIAALGNPCTVSKIDSRSPVK
jgi:hypothetical protein